MSANKAPEVIHTLPDTLSAINGFMRSKEFQSLNKKTRLFLEQLYQEAKFFMATMINSVYATYQDQDKIANYFLAYNLSKCNETIAFNNIDKIRKFISTVTLSVHLREMVTNLRLAYQGFQQGQALLRARLQTSIFNYGNASASRAILYNFAEKNRVTYYVYDQSQDFLQASYSLKGHCAGHVIAWSLANTRGVAYVPHYNLEVSVFQKQHPEIIEGLNSLSSQKNIRFDFDCAWARKVMDAIDARPNLQLMLCLLREDKPGHAIGVRQLAAKKYEFYDPDVGQFVLNNRKELLNFLQIYVIYAKTQRYSNCFIRRTLLNPVVSLPKEVQQYLLPLVRPGQTLVTQIAKIIKDLQPSQKLKQKWLGTTLHDGVTLKQYIYIKTANKKNLLMELHKLLKDELQASGHSRVDFIISELTYRFDVSFSSLKQSGVIVKTDRRASGDKLAP